MKPTTLQLLACPQCRSPLDDSRLRGDSIQEGCLTCPRCHSEFKIAGGIPHFIRPESLSGLNKRFARIYDRVSWGYRFFSRVAFAFIGMSEEMGRHEITDRLEPRGRKVLEVSIGPGVNLPYIVKRQDVGEVFGLDISLGQLKHCQRFASKNGWEVELFLGNAEKLPFQDGSFESVFHIGGINFFNDKQAAIEEMIRVAKPGARILISDEYEKGAKGYERLFPGFSRHFDGKRKAIVPPVDLVPEAMLETCLFDVWKGWFYCIEFRKP